jgi:hypothetical protein
MCEQQYSRRKSGLQPQIWPVSWQNHCRARLFSDIILPGQQDGVCCFRASAIRAIRYSVNEQSTPEWRRLLASEGMNR